MKFHLIFFMCLTGCASGVDRMDKIDQFCRQQTNYHERFEAGKKEFDDDFLIVSGEYSGCTRGIWKWEGLIE